MSSFRKVNYSLRPAKHAQRRMVSELLGCLYPFKAVRDYQYIGFGSLWFEDFRLFHKLLGFKKMVSIERSEAKDRFLHNKPFKAIDLLFGDSGAKLPEIDWTKESIVWLDFDSPLSLETLRDIQLVSASCKSGSCLAITLKVDEAAEILEATKAQEEISHAVAQFTSRFKDYYGGKVFSDDLRGNPFRQVCEAIVDAAVEQKIALRNTEKEGGDVFEFRRVCRFSYSDATPMLTVLYVFYIRSDQSKFDECSFETVDFLPNMDHEVKIQMPVMTLKEIREIEEQLPTDDIDTLDAGYVPPSDVKKFVSIYRYLPNFSVLET